MLKLKCPNTYQYCINVNIHVISSCQKMTPKHFVSKTVPIVINLTENKKNGTWTITHKMTTVEINNCQKENVSLSVCHIYAC